MRNRIGGIYGRNLWRSFSRVTLASVAMGAVAWGSSHFIRSTLGLSKRAQLLDLAVTIPLGIAVLWFACRALGVSELETAVNALAGPLRRRLRSRGN
jgi:putative peptidoglycan lipid II flippase